MSNREKAIKMLQQLADDAHPGLSDSAAQELDRLLGELRATPVQVSDEELVEMQGFVEMLHSMLPDKRPESVIDRAERTREHETCVSDHIDPDTVLEQLEQPGANAVLVQAVMRVDFLVEMEVDIDKLRLMLIEGKTVEQAVQELWDGSMSDAHPTTDEPLGKHDHGVDHIHKLAIGYKHKGPMPPAGHA